MSEQAKQVQGLVANIVAAYVSKNAVAETDLPTVIQSVYSSLNNLGKAPTEPTRESVLKPFVPIKRSVTPDAIVCLECGKKGSMLKRHLESAHGLTPDEYRAKWSLPNDYPMVAPNYSAQRSDLAKASGLGQSMTSRRRKKQ